MRASLFEETIFWVSLNLIVVEMNEFTDIRPLSTSPIWCWWWSTSSTARRSLASTMHQEISTLKTRTNLPPLILASIGMRTRELFPNRSSVATKSFWCSLI